MRGAAQVECNKEAYAQAEEAVDRAYQEFVRSLEYAKDVALMLARQNEAAARAGGAAAAAAPGDLPMEDEDDVAVMEGPVQGLGKRKRIDGGDQHRGSSRGSGELRRYGSTGGGVAGGADELWEEPPNLGLGPSPGAGVAVGAEGLDGGGTGEGGAEGRRQRLGASGAPPLQQDAAAAAAAGGVAAVGGATGPLGMGRGAEGAGGFGVPPGLQVPPHGFPAQPHAQLYPQQQQQHYPQQPYQQHAHQQQQQQPRQAPQVAAAAAAPGPPAAAGGTGPAVAPGPFPPGAGGGGGGGTWVQSGYTALAGKQVGLLIG